MSSVGFETRSTRMERIALVQVFAPEEDVERIMARVTEIDPLAQGARYDCNAYQSAPGIERYRPLEGAAAGPEAETRKRPGVVEVCFEVAHDEALLASIVEAIFQVHSYQEPVIRIHPVLSCRSKGLDDSQNPNRWWNTTGDWAKAVGAPSEG